jgi:hypothetical protein
MARGSKARNDPRSNATRGLVPLLTSTNLREAQSRAHEPRARLTYLCVELNRTDTGS